jgi:hypothetical protein
MSEPINPSQMADEAEKTVELTAEDLQSIAGGPTAVERPNLIQRKDG